MESIATATPSVVYVSAEEDSSGNVTVHCQPDEVPVSEQYTTLYFQLVSSGYHFPESGAVVLTPSDPQFPLVAWRESDTLVKLFDFNTDSAAHPYQVYVRKNGTNQLFSHDPTILNGR